MSIDFARPLNTNNLAVRFLEKALSFNPDLAGNYSLHVSKAEKLLESMSPQPTLFHTENRHPRYATNNGRELLRQKIFKELVGLPRLKDDEEISMGTGGAKPSIVKAEKQAYILIGLPASGKSTVASLIADEYSAFVVDSDYAKRKFPEYEHEYGASILHEESALVTFGLSDKKFSGEPSLIEYCVAKEFNIVIPKIGHDIKSLCNLKGILINKGYSVHLTLICLNRIESCKRALMRYIETSRYVPLGLIFDGYGNDPILSYFKTKEDHDWITTGKVSTLNLRDKGPLYVEGDFNNPASIFREADGDEKRK